MKRELKTYKESDDGTKIHREMAKEEGVRGTESGKKRKREKEIDRGRKKRQCKIESLT